MTIGLYDNFANPQGWHIIRGALHYYLILNVERNNKTEPLAPVTPLAETRMVSYVHVEVGPVDVVRWHVGLGVPDEGDSPAELCRFVEFVPKAQK